MLCSVEFLKFQNLSVCVKWLEKVCPNRSRRHALNEDTTFASTS